MRKILTLSVALALAACASQPKRDLDFERLQADWRTLDSAEDRARAPLESARVDDAITAIQSTPKKDRELRKHLLWYTRGRRGGIHFRRDADKLQTAADVARLIDQHFPPGGPGFEADPAFTPAEDGE